MAMTEGAEVGVLCPARAADQAGARPGAQCCGGQGASPTPCHDDGSGDGPGLQGRGLVGEGASQLTSGTLWPATL